MSVLVSRQLMNNHWQRQSSGSVIVRTIIERVNQLSDEPIFEKCQAGYHEERICNRGIMGVL